MRINGCRIWVMSNGYIEAECGCGACNYMRHDGMWLICDRCGERLDARDIAIRRGERACVHCGGMVDYRAHCNVCGVDD